MNKVFKYDILGGVIVSMMVLMTSCTKDPNSPGVEYMPDMYRSPSYETYGENPLFEDGLAAREPVEGTMSRGEFPNEDNLLNALPYPYPNTPEGYESAGADLKNPFPTSDETIAEGKVIYEKMCMHCHGEEGKGNGSLIQTEKFPPPPSYSGPLRELPEGKMFHTITYGKGLMGSHASQVTKEERWKVIQYIQTLQQL